MPKPSLIVTAGASVYALWARLAERYDLITPTTQLAQNARNLGAAEATAIPDYFGPGESEVAATQTAQLTARVVAGLPRIQERLAERYADLPARPAPLNGHFPDWFPGYALHHAQQLANRVTALDNLARQRQVIGVVVHEDLTPDQRSLVLWARARGIPSIHVPHAPCHLRPETPDIHRATLTDHIAASGPRMAEFYQESGTGAEVEITGAPQWDGLYSGRIPGHDEARRVLALPKDQAVLLYATTWTQTTSLRSEFDAELRAGLAAALAAAKAVGALPIIKLHPGEPPQAEQYYSQALQAAGLAGLVTRQHSLYCLRAADVVLAQGPSNICIEAAALGAPAAYIQTEGFDYRALLPFRAPAERVVDAVQAALASHGAPEWHGFVAEYNAAHGAGDAVERTVALVERVCPA